MLQIKYSPTLQEHLIDQTSRDEEVKEELEDSILFGVLELAVLDDEVFLKFIGVLAVAVLNDGVLFISIGVLEMPVLDDEVLFESIGVLEVAVLDAEIFF